MGTRLREETEVRPKPLVDIGGRPILWHILQQYIGHGYDDFVLALGYKGERIKEYFLDYHSLSSDLEVDLMTGEVKAEATSTLPCRVSLVDTGEATMTGGRVKRLQRTIGRERFMLTYGDGVSDVDLRRLIAFHDAHGKLATVTAVRPSARFGNLVLEGEQVRSFKEKPQTGEGWINGGFFVFEPEVFDYIESDQTVLEAEPLERLAADGQLKAFRHAGFWQCMDNVRDRDYLAALAKESPPPWLRSRLEVV